jgi:hypothetical protein
MRHPGLRRGLGALLFLLCAAGAAPEPPADPSTVPEALSRLAKASSPAEYAASLEAFSTSLAPTDALVLIDKALPALAPEQRGQFLVKAGDLALLLGLFGESASRYEEAGGQGPVPDSALLLRASRCYLAAGEMDKAEALASKLGTTTEDRTLSGSARLVGAWALALQGHRAEACSRALGLLDMAEAPAQRREARFIVWLFAAPEAKAGAASKLTEDFPDSLEASIASGLTAPPPLPHWYLGGLASRGDQLPPPGALPAKQAPSAPTAAQPQTPASAMPATAAKTQSPQGRRLQLGYFSIEENAQALRDELLARHFAASIEQRTRTAGSGKGEQRRWIVLVEAGKDLSKTAQALKDAGYEAYQVE